MTDKERLDWLEEQANKDGGILLHDGSKAVGRLGLGLRPGRRIRTLREAIDEARGSAKLPEETQIGDRVAEEDERRGYVALACLRDGGDQIANRRQEDADE